MLRILLVLLSFALLLPAQAAEKIRVVTRNVEPFSFEKDGRRTGFAMDLWADVARQTGLDYEIVVVNTAQEMVDALANKTADAGVAALSVTSKREAVIDFSQPFYDSGLQIAVIGGSSSIGDTIWQLLTEIFTLKLVGAFALLVVVMLIISHLVWLYEHKVNADMWPEKYVHGMWESFWWTISTLLVGGADNKGPVGVGGRIIAIIWMLLSIVLVSLLTASFTTTLTVNSLSGDIKGPGDLPHHKVATVGGSNPENYLKKLSGVDIVAFPNVQECLLALKKKDVEAVVYDAPMLQYALKQLGGDEIRLIEPVFDNQNYAIGLQQDSPLRERINQALLNLNETGTVTELQGKYFKTETE